MCNERRHYPCKRRNGLSVWADGGRQSDPGASDGACYLSWGQGKSSWWFCCLQALALPPLSFSCSSTTRWSSHRLQVTSFHCCFQLSFHQKHSDFICLSFICLSTMLMLTAMYLRSVTTEDDKGHLKLRDAEKWWCHHSCQKTLGFICWGFDVFALKSFAALEMTSPWSVFEMWKWVCGWAGVTETRCCRGLSVPAMGPDVVCETSSRVKSVILII